MFKIYCQDPSLKPWLVAQAVDSGFTMRVLESEIYSLCERYGLWHHVQVRKPPVGQLWRNDGLVAIKGKFIV